MTVTGLGTGEAGLESLPSSPTDPRLKSATSSFRRIGSIWWLASRGFRW